MSEDEDDEEDEEGLQEDPLGQGTDSVSWLPSVIGQTAPASVESVREGVEILPLFPLGGIVYTPNTNHILNIFEPRYRQMYNDILMNGSKRFVVSMSHPDKQGAFAQMGVLFQLEDLKEVSEQTNDQIKYICNHKVIGRVWIHRILNPKAWTSRQTYLKVEGTIIQDVEEDDNKDTNSKLDDEDEEQDSDKSIKIKAGLTEIYSSLIKKAKSTLSAASSAGMKDAAPKQEDALRKSFSSLVELQHQLQEDVRFTRASVSALSLSPGSKGDDTLWSTIRLWQSYTEQRLVARQNELQREFQEKLLQFLMKDKGVKEEELPSAIGFADLSPQLQQEVKDLQKRMAVELRPLILESTLAMQKILEANDHKNRLNLLRFFVDAERKRLEARKTLQGMFAAPATPVTPVTPEEKAPPKNMPNNKNDQKDFPNDLSSIFTDEEDAFQ